MACFCNLKKESHDCISALQARVKELVAEKNKFDEECRRYIELRDEALEENARLRKVVDAARSFMTMGNSGLDTAKNFSALLESLHELDGEKLPEVCPCCGNKPDEDNDCECN